MNGECDWVPLFPEDEIPRILRIVERCAAKLTKSKPQELENSLSDRLRVFILQDREYRDDLDAQLHQELTIFDQTGAQTKQLGRGDILFEHGTGKRKPYPYFLIEAKRLHVTSKDGKWKSLISDYVTGKQGMMSFINERYSRDLASGAMLGYVFDGAVEKARDAVHEAVIKHAANLRSVEPHGLSRCDILNTQAGCSHHLIVGREFKLYHLFCAV